MLPTSRDLVNQRVLAPVAYRQVHPTKKRVTSHGLVLIGDPLRCFGFYDRRPQNMSPIVKDQILLYWNSLTRRESFFCVPGMKQKTCCHNCEWLPSGTLKYGRHYLICSKTRVNATWIRKSSKSVIRHGSGWPTSGVWSLLILPNRIQAADHRENKHTMHDVRPKIVTRCGQCHWERW